jgi:hypothetical protein
MSKKTCGHKGRISRLSKIGKTEIICLKKGKKVPICVGEINNSCREPSCKFSMQNIARSDI